MTVYTIRDISPMLLKLWQNKFIIILFSISGLLAGMAFTVNREPEISSRATSSVCVTYTTYQEQLRGSTAITSYSDLVRSSLVCQRAAELVEGLELTTESIQNMVTNRINSNSNVMYITVTTKEPQNAIMVANAVALAFTEKISSISGNNSLQVLDTAYTAETIVNSFSTLIILSVLTAFILVCAFIVIKEIVGGKIRIIFQCAEDPDEILGILPNVK